MPLQPSSQPVLITGAGGFIGSHLVQLCAERGLRVRAFVHYNGLNRWGWLEESPVREQVEVVSGDVRDFDSVHRAMQGCQAVLHLAALIGIPYSYVSPLAYLKTNVEGTYNILEAARMLQTPNVLVTSTSETYGTAQTVPINERHPLAGQSPYSASKIGADQLAYSYYCSFGLPVRIVRPFNCYGPRQSARAFIPTVITQLLAGQTELKLGNLHPTRDLTYVQDTAAGILAVAQCEALIGEVTNIGMNDEISMGDLARKIAGILNMELTVKSDPDRIRPDRSEVERLRADNTRILEQTDWRPRYSLDQGLADTIDWLKEHRQLYKAGIYAL